MHNSLLWKIKSDHSHEAYLFGTMHLGTERSLSLAKGAFPFLERCSILYNETEIEKLISAQPLMLPSNKKLPDFISIKKYLKAEKYFYKIAKIPLHRFEQLYPLYLTEIISKSLLKNTSLETPDTLLFKHAKLMELQTTGLEKFEEQQLTLKNLPINIQVNGFLKLLSNTAKAKNQLELLINRYELQEIHRLYKMSKKQLAKLRKPLLYQRNIIMAKRMADYSINEKCFFAVGAGHLSGAKGVLRLLKQHGFNLSPIKI